MASSARFCALMSCSVQNQRPRAGPASSPPRSVAAGSRLRPVAGDARTDGAHPARRSGFIEHIADGGLHLLTLINEILNVAQIEAFNRLGQDTSSEEGSGIGLVVTSEPGVGTVFYMELPQSVARVQPGLPDFRDGDHAWMVAAADAQEGVPPWPNGTTLEDAAVPCVDDDPASLRLLQQVLATLPGVRLPTASNGRLGVEMAPPSLVVMDTTCPRRAAARRASACARIRARPRSPWSR
jgi:hypothetical protein